MAAAHTEFLQSAAAAGLRYITDETPGIVRRKRGAGFIYQDAEGRVVRDAATLDRIRRLAIPPAWQAVWISPIENGHLQAAGRDARGRKQYRYHARYSQVRNQTKFDRLLSFGAALPGIRRRVQEDLRLPGMPKEKVTAAIVKLLDETCIRIGNDEYARANDSYGLTTLQNRHADVRGETIRLRFHGKSGLEHEVSLRDERLARIVKRCQDLPGKELFQYQTDSGEFQSIGSADVNEYLRQIAGEEISAKDFRTWHGTAHMLSQLTSLGPAKSESEAKHLLAQAVRATAQKLGNRAATCRNYYIHPAVIEGYLDQTIFSNSARAACRPVRSLRAEEMAVLRLVKAFDRSARKRSQTLCRALLDKARSTAGRRAVRAA